MALHGDGNLLASVTMEETEFTTACMAVTATITSTLKQSLGNRGLELQNWKLKGYLKSLHKEWDEDQDES